MRQKYLFSLLVLLISASQFIFAQELSVTGKVVDASGEALPGVNVLVKGTTKGTSTDFDGKYSIDAAKGEVLVFTFVGFSKQETPVTGSSMNVIMSEDSDQLDEVVITAFGIEKQTKELGYSVSQVKTEDLDLSGQTNALNALQGRVAGLTITQTSGGAGAGADILIRGITLGCSRKRQPTIDYC
ncbi:MAG: carboxypeptidase-like regulatory domain-containing protein [Flavobacteriaceae bacterium]|nr:carboxypeptidase-like regulatory domain-containing protein [Flavobacteriaceae bacterium]